MAPRDQDDTAPPGALSAGRYRAVLALIVACGLALRLWNAGTAWVHDDELHYVGDAAWTIAPISLGEAIEFLREHPQHHLRLDARTGEREPWRERPGEVARLGHPCLVPIVMGAVLRLVGPSSPNDAVHVGRMVNAVLDTLTILLLPPLVRTLGAGRGAGVLAAGLYAVFPPAVTYGSIAYLDPILAPLLLVLLLALLDPTRGAGAWLVAGIATGLLVSAKQSGLIAFVLVPLAAVALPPRRLGGLVIWLVVSCGVAAVLTDPAAYLSVLQRPSRPIGKLHFTPLHFLAGNLASLMQPSTYYWLSFARHGEPLAPLLARLHPVLTPAYLIAYLAGGAAAVAAGDRRRLLALYAPAVLTLGFIVPSDGMWRFHLLSPLVCAAAVLPLPAPRRVWRVAVVGLAVLVGVTPLLPQRPQADGTVDFGDLLFMNPQARQQPSFHGPRHPLLLVGGAGMALSRLLWLRPGTYEVAVAERGTVAITLDGQPVLADATGRAELVLEGRIHRLTLAFPGSAVLQRLAIRGLEPPPARTADVDPARRS